MEACNNNFQQLIGVQFLDGIVELASEPVCCMRKSGVRFQDRQRPSGPGAGRSAVNVTCAGSCIQLGKRTTSNRCFKGRKWWRRRRRTRRRWRRTRRRRRRTRRSRWVCGGWMQTTVLQHSFNLTLCERQRAFWPLVRADNRWPHAVAGCPKS